MMEQFYTASVLLNEDTFKRVMEETMDISTKQKKHIKWRRLIYLIAAASMGFLAYFGFTRISESWVYIVEGIASSALAIFFLIRALFFKQLVMRKGISRSLELQQQAGTLGKTDEYRFYEDYFQAKTQRYKLGKRIDWKSVTNVFELRSYYFIYAKVGNQPVSFFFEKATIDGDGEAFHKYLESSIPCKIAHEI
ncbi:MAG: hypothetical protein UE970_12055 [Catenibacillus sp.]|nr:hypothetical protein [Catenibacillus sp.]